MKGVITVLAIIAFVVGIVGAEHIQPQTDILTKNADGEYVKVFGPWSFSFDGTGFSNPVSMLNGTAKIGELAK